METILDYINLKYIISAVVFSLLGVIILAIAFYIFDKLTPGNLWHEIVVNKNIALAITTAAMTLAIAQIIASAIHG
ncbi:DUF350 domain-containing protein [Pigmentibacter sp. JX0631]|uniref:DUF350 domain-containing protein n=1 Tax=Pigmentibacter sp. JX0631 TaxID=2976982 RepID=UPI002469096C|nr:DUF350 domain-containing protein [Pigmentibacter sp. JX0631]WGL58914.1 DUF350 domain-containing protein [Pigmentibacter sp. JX0631]